MFPSNLFLSVSIRDWFLVKLALANLRPMANIAVETFLDHGMMRNGMPTRSSGIKGDFVGTVQASMVVLSIISSSDVDQYYTSR